MHVNAFKLFLNLTQQGLIFKILLVIYLHSSLAHLDKGIGVIIIFLCTLKLPKYILNLQWPLYLPYLLNILY